MLGSIKEKTHHKTDDLQYANKAYFLEETLLIGGGKAKLKTSHSRPKSFHSFRKEPGDTSRPVFRKAEELQTKTPLMATDCQIR